MNWTKGWAAPSRSDPVFELLEDRRLFAAHPTVTFDGGDATLIGETARIIVTLSSVSDGSPGSDAGYSPYIDLILLTKGADCSASDVNPAQIKDGAAFQRAPLNGQSAQATQTELNSSGTAIHPLARDQNCDLRVVGLGDYGAQPGDTLVVPCLTFGSYAPSQPAAFVSGSAPRRRQTCMSCSPFRRRPLRVDHFHTQAWERHPLRRLRRRQLQRHAERHGDADRLPVRRRENVYRHLILASKCRCLRFRVNPSQLTS